jgi:hypothetical protein
MDNTIQDYQSLKNDFAQMMEQCNRIHEEKEQSFQLYRERIQEELQTLSRQREAFDDALNRKLKKLEYGEVICAKLGI